MSLPKNHRKLTIQQSMPELAKMGYVLIRGMSNVTGPTRYLFKKDGHEVQLDSDQIKRMLGYTVKASSIMASSMSDPKWKCTKCGKLTETNPDNPSIKVGLKQKMRCSSCMANTTHEVVAGDQPHGASSVELAERNVQHQMTTVARI